MTTDRLHDGKKLPKASFWLISSGSIIRKAQDRIRGKSSRQMQRTVEQTQACAHPTLVPQGCWSERALDYAYDLFDVIGVTVVGEILEIGAQCSIRLKAVDSFERYFAQLKSYYKKYLIPLS